MDQEELFRAPNDTVWDSEDEYLMGLVAAGSDFHSESLNATGVLGIVSVGRRALNKLDDALRSSGGGGNIARRAGWSDELADGATLATDDALDAAEDFLGPGYRDLGDGRYLSADGTRQVRMGDLDITGQHAGGPHMNFERLEADRLRPGRFNIVENRHILLVQE